MFYETSARMGEGLVVSAEVTMDVRRSCRGGVQSSL